MNSSDLIAAHEAKAPADNAEWISTLTLALYPKAKKKLYTKNLINGTRKGVDKVWGHRWPEDAGNMVERSEQTFIIFVSAQHCVKTTVATVC